MGIWIFINDKLLRTLAKYEFRVGEAAITDTMVEEHLTKILRPARFFVPDLDRLFGRLRLWSTGEGRDRVTPLFADIEEIFADNGLEYLPDKDIIKNMNKGLPPRVEKSVKAMLKLEERG